jgi:hypothetical protein
MEKNREYTKTPTGYKKIYSVEKFRNRLVTGAIISIDGDAFWCKNGAESNDSAFETPPLDADSVVFYEK